MEGDVWYDRIVGSSYPRSQITPLRHWRLLIVER